MEGRAELSLAVAASGYVLSGGSGVQDLARTSVSLVNLVLFLVPLTSLLIGVLSLAPERGAAELLFSQPVPRRTILLGKLAGLLGALAAAQALVVWFASVVLFDVAALGLASLLPSGAASRVLIVGVLVNPVDAVRTGALLGTSGTAAFGAASLAFLRFTRGTLGAGLLLSASVLVWVVLPVAVAARRLGKADI